MQVSVDALRTAPSSEIELGSPVAFTSTDGQNWDAVSDSTSWSQVTYIKADGLKFK